MRRSLRVLLLVGMSLISSGCGLCGRPPLIPQAYVAPACDPCAAAPVVARPSGAVVAAPAAPTVVVP